MLEYIAKVSKPSLALYPCSPDKPIKPHTDKPRKRTDMTRTRTSNMRKRTDKLRKYDIN